MKDIYQDLPRLKVELSLTAIIIFILTVLGFLVLPISLLNSNNNQISLNSVFNNISNNLSFNSLEISNSNQVIIIIGLIIVLLSLGIIIYFLLENFYQRRIQKESNISYKKRKY